ncbi:MAG: EAL domain-containing protein [Acidimicrobiia bacterium]
MAVGWRNGRGDPARAPGPSGPPNGRPAAGNGAGAAALKRSGAGGRPGQRGRPTPPLPPGGTAVPLWRILEAIATGQVLPHYQPIVSLRSGDVVGVEALARWVVPGHGVIPASMFVPVLEQHRRVGELTACMLERACGDLATWRDRGDWVRRGFRVSINVSATELADGRLPALVRAVTADHAMEADWLCLELTETAQIDNFALARRILSELAFDVGVRLAVDDYGTGFADGKYLTSLPIDTVKIDQSFVSGMVQRPDHAAFVRATVGYAAHRELGVVAEGVDSTGHTRALLSVGCTIGQGFALGPPRPAAFISDSRFGAVAVQPGG